MMGIPVKGASYMYGDNMSAVTNTSKPESTLKKKYNLICYHAAHEAVAMCEALVAHIPTKKNLADLFTEVLYGQARRFLVSGCSGTCSPERMHLCSQGERVRLMTGLVFLGLRSTDQVGVKPAPFVPECILPRLTWCDPAKLGGLIK
jgi:hypothetical protein